MKYLSTLTIILGIALLSSCVRHEIIPKPKYEATLPVSFTGLIEGAKFEIIENVKGYHCNPSQAKEILPTPQPSKIVYYSSLETEEKLEMIQLRVGKLIFSSNNSSTPSVEEFNEFFENGITTPIQYKENSEDGVEIVFRDSQGKVWTSNESSIAPQDFEFVKITPDADDSGEYVKFVAKFNVTLYYIPLDPLLMESLEIRDALFEGYFKR